MRAPLSPLQRFFISIVLWTAMVWAVAWFDWRGFSLLQERAASLLRVRRATVDLEEKRNSLLGEWDRLWDHMEDIRRMRGVFVVAEAPLPFFEILERLAARDKLSLELSVPQRRADTMTMQIEVVGNEKGVLGFLESVEVISEQVVIKEMAVERLQDRSSSEAVGASRQAISARAFGVIEFLAR